MLYYAILRYTLCYAMLCYAMLCYVTHAVLCFVTMGYAMLCYVVLCYAMLLWRSSCDGYGAAVVISIATERCLCDNETLLMWRPYGADAGGHWPCTILLGAAYKNTDSDHNTFIASIYYTYMYIFGACIAFIVLRPQHIILVGMDHRMSNVLLSWIILIKGWFIWRYLLCRHFLTSFLLALQVALPSYWLPNILFLTSFLLALQVC